MSKENDSSEQQDTTRETSKSFLTRPRLVAGALALGGMIVGSVVGLGVQMGAESTGLLGPSVEALIAEQQSNFTDVNARLDALKDMSNDKAVIAELTELGKLLNRQDELARQANAELAYLGEQVTELKDRQLADAGFSGGADLWLKSGESVNVGSRDNVFGLLGTRSNFADINLNGTRKRVYVGDPIPVEGDGTDCTIFYKQAKPRADGRVGFDLSCG
ncbi:MAG: hypothetical protein OEW68_00020 [Gammaproteobacteria bacterium]|nr:hypothetical protein [Gammaproteobacteria bacterium]MDH4313209.1 hypothetical protein [Gammaproteobacteria bacterium]MDH5215636.1 hypothetical protein [Gammaproteobacteria bacterium]